MKRTNITVLKTKIKLLSTVFLLMFFLCIGKSQNLEVQNTLSEGTYLELIMHSSSLENNFLGDSPDREVSVYLPPGYYSSPDNHYPVIYFLHSFGLDHTGFFGGFWDGVDFTTICDDLIGSGEIDPMIVVSPNAYNKYWGSIYRNSSVTGNWEDFITDDLINYVDSNFRTLSQKESRGLAGHSMGGHGTIWLIMNYPDIFNAAYAFSADVDIEELYLVTMRDNMIKAVNANSLEGLEWQQVVCIALAAAIAPDSLAPPFYAQFPLDDSGVLIDSIWQKWLQHDILTSVPSFKDSLLQLQAIQFDVGINDAYSGFITGNRNFSQALIDLDIEHVFEEYFGGHSNKLAERIETKLLPFFSANLSKNMLDDTVSIPDSVFLHALIEEGVDTNENGQISYEEAEAVISLILDWPVSGGKISDLSGIEAFVNLEELDCSGNQLPSLDVSTYTALHGFNCSYNQIASLDVTQNTALVYFSCEYNQLTSLDVSKNTNLEEFSLSGNQLTTLDISNNRNLRQFTRPSGGPCLYVDNMPSLTEICVWEGFNLDDYSPAIDTAGSPNICFQTDCNGDCRIVGIVDDIHESGISIYPNPANTILTIETVSSFPIDYELTSLNGQLVIDGEMDGTSHQIDLSPFQKGVYLITIRTSDFVTTEKIIKL